MTLRPLPKTVAPLRDELLSGWLARLAASNYCEISELLAHVGLDSRYADTLDFELNAEAAGRIAAMTHEARVAVIARELRFRYRWGLTPTDVMTFEKARIGRDADFKGPRPTWAPLAPS